MKKNEVERGTIRIRVKDRAIVEKTVKSWKKSSLKLPNAVHAIKLFAAHNNIDVLIDKKNPKFFKGQLSPSMKVQGARIDMLPNGELLDKTFSLFAPLLTIHDQSSHDHWDVLYQNPNEDYAYIYTKSKAKKHKVRKYKKVQEFQKHHANLKKNVSKALLDKSDHIALPMFTLLKTYMRVGNEIYFRAHGHKGLSTLQKKDVTILNDNKVSFEFLAKNGVPMSITEEFPDEYVSRLKMLLEQLQRESFLFTTPKTKHPLSDTHFKHAFFKYCGKEFYPHIVRSFFATKEVKKFLSSKKKPTKEEARTLCKKIAHKLGHKKYDKKKNEWTESYTVTLNHYVEPKLAEKMRSILR